MGSLGAVQDLYGLCRIIWDHDGSFGVMGDRLESLEIVLIIRDHTEILGTVMNH